MLFSVVASHNASTVLRKHRIVVSSENTPYMGWQTKLFYFSCVSRLNHRPIIIVHDSGEDYFSDFYEIIRAGGLIVRAPNYDMTTSGDRYPPRNTAGSLLHAAALCGGEDEFIVLCDPDMIFVSEPSFPDQLAGDYCPYMDYSQPEVMTAAERLGIPPATIEEQGNALRCGVPYVVPVAGARVLAEHWLEAVDAIQPPDWTAVMYAFGLAALRLRLPVTLTNLVITNCYPESALTQNIVHYCYGDKAWQKRDYITVEQAARVWHPAAGSDGSSVTGEISTQIKQASDFYRNPWFAAS